MPVRALIFDFDGTIIDTESAVYETWRELYAGHGHDLPLEVWSQLVGTDYSEAYDPRRDLETLTGKTFDWDAWEDERRERSFEIASRMQPLPGVIERLAEAAALGLPAAIASSSPHRWVSALIEGLGLRERFHHLTTVDDTGRVKPDPSLFLHAIQRLGVKADEALIIEDSLNGLRAAQAAGIRCLIVPGPTTRHLDFTGAWRVADSLDDISIARIVAEAG